ATGEQLRTEGYEGASMLPTPAVSIGQFLGCATVGSRVVVAVPETDQDGSSVWVLDVLSAKPSRATGKDQKPVKGMPTVELAPSGAPTVTIPEGEPGAETEVALLKKGDGAIVASGDSVMVQYTGVRWSNGTVFGSSWSQGTPTALVTTELIDGYREALEGHTVGSQVLVVIPPEFAYGEGQINENDLTGETLVFVIDILATAPEE
ncbi:MAG: FKBP-type peptidyl-prolyl cis-trans isomerase, partial [Microbacteriaceae bacterium]